MVGPVAGAAGKVAKLSAKYAVKYGPHAAAAAKVLGPQAVDAAKSTQANRRHKRNAVEKARTLAAGSVLRTRHRDDVIWVVFAGDEPVDSYPPVDDDLTDFTAKLDLGKRRTPEQIDAARLRKRAQRAAESRGRNKRTPKALDEG